MVKKQFIAGAKCPECNEVDVLQMYNLNESYYRECVECHFLEKMVEENNEENLEINIKNI